MVEAESRTNKQPAARESTPGVKYVTRLAALGLGLSAVLEYVHAKTYLRPAAESFCSVGQTFDCAAVAASPSSILLGVPWAIWGALGFASILVAAFQRSIWLLPLTGLAAATSVGLLGLSLLEIGSLCYLCEAVHVTTWILFVLVWRGRGALHGSYRDLAPLTTILGPTAGIGVAVSLFIPAYWASFSFKGEPPFDHGVAKSGFPWIGSKKPTVTIEEFVDYKCPHCRIGSSRSLKLLAKHSDWRVVRRHQPRTYCTRKLGTCLEVRLAQCAQDQGGFWRADRWLFAHTNPRVEPDEKETSTAMAADVGLDLDELRLCMDSDRAYERANDEYLAARKSKIIDIPGYMVDGEKLKPKDVPAFMR